MTFLELCKRVRQEAGISGSGPSTVVGQSGELKRVVDWTASAYEDLQIEREDWRWMRGSFSFQTTANDRDYTSVEAGIASRFSHWHLDRIKSYKTATGINSQVVLGHLSYEEWASRYDVGSLTTTPGQPLLCAAANDNKLLLAPVPNGIYTISGEYQKSPQLLTVDADTPELPTQYHLAIVYRALMMYARYDAAGEIYNDALANYQRIMRPLERLQLPEIGFAGPLI